MTIAPSSVRPAATLTAPCSSSEERALVGDLVIDPGISQAVPDQPRRVVCPHPARRGALVRGIEESKRAASYDDRPFEIAAVVRLLIAVTPVVRASTVAAVAAIWGPRLEI
jgi:hypothetical protein